METKRTVFPSALIDSFDMNQYWLDEYRELLDKAIFDGSESRIRFEKEVFILQSIKYYTSLKLEFDRLLFHTPNTELADKFTNSLVQTARYIREIDDESFMDFFIDEYYPKISQLIFELLTAEKERGVND